MRSFLKNSSFLRNFRLLTPIFSRNTRPIYNPRPVLNSVKPALSNEINRYNHHVIFDFQFPDWSEIFENFFAKNFFDMIIKLLYILNFDEKPQYRQPADHPRAMSKILDVQKIQSEIKERSSFSEFLTEKL